MESLQNHVFMSFESEPETEYHTESHHVFMSFESESETEYHTESHHVFMSFESESETLLLNLKSCLHEF